MAVHIDFVVLQELSMEVIQRHLGAVESLKSN